MTISSRIDFIQTLHKNETEMKNAAKVRMLLNYLFKAGLFCLGTGFLVIALLVWQRAHGRSRWDDEIISENVVAYGFYDNTCRVFNTKTGRFTTGKIAWTSTKPQNDSITPYADLKGHRGYLNALTGEITLNSKNFRFVRAWHFSEGKAFVQGENGKLGVIDHTGNLCVPMEIPFEIGMDYVFKNGLCKIVRYNGESGWTEGLLRSNGTWALPMQYHDISDANPDGYRIVRDDSGDLLLDGDFKPVFDCHYDNISFAQEGGVFITDKHWKWLADYSGKVIRPYVFDATHELYYLIEHREDDVDKYELDDELMVYEVGQFEGLFDKRTGKILTTADYWNLSMLSKDVICAQLLWGDGQVFLNRKGQVIEHSHETEKN